MTTVLFPFFMLLLAGYCCRFLKHAPRPHEIRKALHTIVMWFFLPALQFQVMSSATPDHSFIVVPAIALLTLALSLLIAVMTYKVFEFVTAKKIPRATLGTLIMAAAWGNITFLGLPLLTALYGKEGQKIAMLYDVLAIGPAIYILGPVLGSIYGGATALKKSTLKSGLKSFLKMPPLWSVLAGIVFNLSGLTLPAEIIKSLTLLGSAVTPLMVFAVGLALELPVTYQDLKQTLIILPAAAVKLVISPLTALFVITVITSLSNSQFRLTVQQTQAITLEAGMPTMVVTLLMAEAGGLNITVAARIIAFSTIASFATLPLLRLFF